MEGGATRPAGTVRAALRLIVSARTRVEAFFPPHAAKAVSDSVQSARHRAATTLTIHHGAIRLLATLWRAAGRWPKCAMQPAMRT